MCSSDLHAILTESAAAGTRGIIEEDRGQIGILKSLGYSSRHIDRYYLSYGLRGGILGCLLGEGLGFIIFPKVISNAYIMMYQLPETEVKIRWDIAIGVMLITLGCIAVTVLSACRSEIKEKTASLLLPKAPKAGKRIFLEKIRPLWKRLRFSQKVTLRNLFRYKKRFFMTTMGVAGCFALLLTGFGVRDAIGDIVEIQYDEIYHIFRLNVCKTFNCIALESLLHFSRRQIGRASCRERV